MPLEPATNDYINNTGYSDLSNITSLEDLKRLSGKIPKDKQSIPIVDIPEISVGDWVQLKLGAKDITNGKVINSGDLYAENTNTWGQVIDIDKDNKSQAKYKINNNDPVIQIGTKDGIVMHTVQQSSITKNRILNNSSSVVIQTLSPIGNLLNLNIKDLSSVGTILNASASILSTLGNNKTAQSIQQGWSKLLYYDNFISSKYKEGENIYNSILELFGKKKENKDLFKTLLGVLGAGNAIQNYISTTNLVDYRSNKSISGSSNKLTEGLNKVLSIVNQAERITNSISNLIGSSSKNGGNTQNGIKTQYIDITNAFKTSGYASTNTKINTTLGNLSSDISKQIGLTGTTGTAGTYNSVDYAKLIGQARSEQNLTDEEQIKKLAEETANRLTYRSLTNEEQKNIWIQPLEGMQVVNNIAQTSFELFPEKQERIKILTNENETLVRNAFNYPVPTDKKMGWVVNKQIKEEAENLKVKQYDYQINIDDPKVSKVSNISIEDQLMKARAQLGIQVHGNARLGKAIKYFLYNRYKNIDGGNLIWHRTMTHVFFTRPDLNLLYNNGPLLSELKNFSEVTLLWQKDPNLFRLLTDYKRTGETHGNNFNLLLSNQIAGFDFKDETITKVETTKTWKDQKIIYGGSYNGRGDGEITCTFIETDELSITNLIRLWIMYIDNVTSGIWRPSYNLRRKNIKGEDYKVNYNDISESSSHIYTRTLDYASSCYAFKIKADGEEILYWTKYYGLIPVSLSLNHLNWQAGSTDTDIKTVSVTFAYSFKKDLSPISLLEFNSVANIDDQTGKSTAYESNFETTFDQTLSDGRIGYPSGVHSGVPLVGAPFIAIQSVNIQNNQSKFIGYSSVDKEGKELPFSLKLKFKPVPNTDKLGESNGESAIDYSRIYKFGYGYHNQKGTQWSLINGLIQDATKNSGARTQSISNPVTGKVTDTGTVPQVNPSVIEDNEEGTIGGQVT